MKNSALKYYPFIPLLLVCCFYAYRAMDFPIHDFANYYFGGRFLAEGNFDSGIYFPYEFNKAIADLGYENIFVSYAPNTPFLAFLFLPFSLLSVAAAKLFFNCISIGLFVCSIYRLFAFYKINPKLALLIPLLFLVPIKNNLLFGQVYFLLFFLLAEGWLAYEKKYLKSTAFFWGLAVLLKVFPVLLLVFLAFKKKWSTIFMLGIFCFVLIGISWFVTGTDIWFFYLKAVLPKASNGEIANSFVDNYQSVFMFLKRMFVYETVENPQPFFHASSLLPAAVLGFKIGVLGIGFFISRKRLNVFYAFSFWIIAMLLLSPYGSTYGLILLIFPFLALIKSEIPTLKKTVFCLILLLICNMPLWLFIERQFPISYLRLFLLLTFFIGLIIIEYKKSILLKSIILACLVFAVVTFFKRESPHKDEALPIAGNPILIFDYEVKDNQLTYFYWNEKGASKVSIPFKSAVVKSLDIKENQIVSKSRILAKDASHKYKPILIDNKTVLYLSDYDRGIGFYTIRKIELK